MYLFDLQNKDDVTYNASKPVVTEVGPYAFSEYFVKFDISWQDGGNQVTFNTQKYYIWDPANSNPGVSLDDRAVLPYLPAIGFEYLLELIPPSVQAMIMEMEKVCLVP